MHPFGAAACRRMTAVLFCPMPTMPNAPANSTGGSLRLASVLTNPNDPWFMRVQLASIMLVLVSVAALMAETVEGVAEEYASTWHALEWVFLVGFGVEYLA